MDTIGFKENNLEFNHSKEAVSCIFCEETFMIHVDIQSILKHLLQVHKFVIGDPHGVADFRQYLMYWKKLQHLPLKDFCIVYLTNTDSDDKDPSETIFLLCDKLPEDKELRDTICQEKLAYLIKQKEFECSDKSFSRQCIYCQRTIEGGITSIFKHLSIDHGFSIGHPENIVFGAKLLDLMEEKLHRLQCLNCEKTFKSVSILREHMRKKQHKSLNPKNKEYDKFYLLNHLKPGTPWEEMKKDHDLTSMNDDECDEYEIWTDWREDSKIVAKCLFCSYTTANIPYGLFEHIRSCHQFDFVCVTKNYNFYHKMKIINFIRSKVSKGGCMSCARRFEANDELLLHMQTSNHTALPCISEWDTPQYMIPFLENDGLLFHIEDNEEEDDDETCSLASSNNDDVVLPEDVSFCMENSSILDNSRLLEEISTDIDGPSHGSDLWCSYHCFFCRFTSSGSNAQNACIDHMMSIHNFKLKDLFQQLDKRECCKVVNYVRYMTSNLQCFVCLKKYTSMCSLEEHRMLKEHLSPSRISYSDSKWNAPTLHNDAFLRA